MSQAELLDDGVLVASGTPFLVMELPGEPKAKGRHRSRIGWQDGKPIVMQYPDPETVKYEAMLGKLAKALMRGRKPSPHPVCVVVHVFRSIPKSWSLRDRADARAGRAVPASKPDADNYLKAVGDALNEIVWEDDDQIVDARCIKRYSDKPALRVEIREMIHKQPV